MTRPFLVLLLVLLFVGLAFAFLSCSEDSPTGSKGTGFFLRVGVQDTAANPLPNLRISAHGVTTDVQTTSAVEIPEGPSPFRAQPQAALADPDAVPGDMNCDGYAMTIADIEMLRDYYFTGLRAFNDWRICAKDNGDADGDGWIWTVSDLQYMFLGLNGQESVYTGPEPARLGYRVVDGDMFVDYLDLPGTVGYYGALGTLYLEVEGLISPFPALGLHGKVYFQRSSSSGLTRIMVTQDTNEISPIRGDILTGISGRILKMEGTTAGASPVRFEIIPTSVALRQNYPNPFNGLTQVPFDLAEYAHWGLRFYDLSGNMVDETDNDGMAGSHTVAWDPTAFGPGVYRYELVEYVGTEASVLDKGYCDYLQIDPDRSVLGYTNLGGTFFTTDSQRFPGIHRLPDLVRTSESSSDPVGVYRYTQDVVFTVTDTATGVQQEYTRTINSGPNKINLVWDE